MSSQYSIISQVPKVDVSPAGQVVKVIEITFKDAYSQVQQSIDIPVEQYSAENVRALILDRLETIRSIADLKD